MVRYTEKLLEKGAERKRLTKQLAALVGNVANDIAQSLPEGTTPKRLSLEEREKKGIPLPSQPWWDNLQVVRVESNLGETKFLALIHYHRKEPTVVFVPDKEPGSRFFLDNDPRAKVRVASAEEYLKFANDLPEIAAAFEMKADELNNDLRSAFDKLKEIASTDAGSNNVGYESVQKRRFADIKGAY
jgi:hypothetical protein